MTGFVLLIGLGLIPYTVSTLNREASLDKQVSAQQQANEAVFDRVWKTISQQAQVSSEYKDSFREIYTDIMQNSTGGSNRLLAFIQSVNPQFDSSIYQTLMATIESNRRDFEREQKKLIDINREHTLMFETIPQSFILDIFNRQPSSITIVTSQQTKEAFSTGEDNNVNLFP